MKKVSGEDEGVAVDQTQIASWLERYEALVQIKPADEATASYHRQQINLLDRELDDLALRAAPELLPARATLARMQRKFVRAIEIWQEHARLNPSDVVTTALRIADIQLLSNDVVNARITLEKIASKKSQLYKKVLSTLENMEGLLASSAQYKLALEQFESGEREAFCMSVLSALALSHGEGIRNNTQVKGLIDDLSFGCTNERCSHDAGDIVLDTDDGPDPVAIFAAGFGWSGSGAVFDFLRQHRDAEPFSSQEIGIFGYGEAGLLRCLAALRRKPATFNSTFARMICHGVLGLSERGDTGTTSVRKAMSRSMYGIFVEDSEKLEKAIKLSRILVRKNIRYPVDGQKRECHFEDSFSEFFKGILRLKKSNKPYLLFSNAISGSHIETARLLPSSSRIVASVRDARDAYADRFIAGRHWTAETFIQKHERNREAYRRSLADHQVREKVIEVQFEDLILSGDCRRALLRKLGMDPDSWIDDGRAFDAKKSARNIRVYPRFEDQSAIRAIESALPCYLYVEGQSRKSVRTCR